MHTDTYDDQSLHRMGCWKIGGRWVSRGSGQKAEPDSEDDIRAIEVGPFEPADVGADKAK